MHEKGAAARLEGAIWHAAEHIAKLLQALLQDFGPVALVLSQQDSVGERAAIAPGLFHSIPAILTRSVQRESGIN
jgi:hypothetical protein